MEVRLGPGDIVLDGDSPPPQKGAWQPPLFAPLLSPASEQAHILPVTHIVKSTRQYAAGSFVAMLPELPPVQFSFLIRLLFQTYFSQDTCSKNGPMGIAELVFLSAGCPSCRKSIKLSTRLRLHNIVMEINRKCCYFHEKAIIFCDRNFADFAKILDLDVFNLVHVSFVTKHLTMSYGQQYSHTHCSNTARLQIVYNIIIPSVCLSVPQSQRALTLHTQ